MTRRPFAPVITALAVGISGCGDDGDTATDCETVTVAIGEFVFDPTPVAINPCDSIVWDNTHDQAHTSTGNGDQTWGTGNIPPGEQSEPVVFPDAGGFSYICALHPFMQGDVRVSA